MLEDNDMGLEKILDDGFKKDAYKVVYFFIRGEE